MDRKTALALVIAAAAAAPAFAEGDGNYQPDPFVSTRTRAEVMAELQEARKSRIDPYADEYNPVHHMRSERTREEVTREYLASRDMVSALNGEDSGSVYFARRDSGQPAATQLASAPVATEE